MWTPGSTDDLWEQPQLLKQSITRQFSKPLHWSLLFFFSPHTKLCLYITNSSVVGNPKWHVRDDMGSLNRGVSIFFLSKFSSNIQKVNAVIPETVLLSLLLFITSSLHYCDSPIMRELNCLLCLASLVPKRTNRIFPELPRTSCLSSTSERPISATQQQKIFF